MTPPLVSPLEGRDWMAEVQAILGGRPDAPRVQREHLQAMAGAQAELTKTSALMNRALVGIMVDNKIPALHLPAGLIAFIEEHKLDLTIEYVRGAITITLMKPTPPSQVN